MSFSRLNFGCLLIICKIPQHHQVRRPMAKTLVHMVLKLLCIFTLFYFYLEVNFGPGGGGGARWMADECGSSQAPLQLPSMMCNGALQWNAVCSASSSRVAAGLALGMDH